MKDYKFVPPPAAADEKPDESGVTPSMLEFDFTRDCEPQVHFFFVSLSDVTFLIILFRPIKYRGRATQ